MASGQQMPLKQLSAKWGESSQGFGCVKVQAGTTRDPTDA